MALSYFLKDGLFHNCSGSRVFYLFIYSNCDKVKCIILEEFIEIKRVIFIFFVWPSFDKNIVIYTYFLKCWKLR